MSTLNSTQLNEFQTRPSDIVGKECWRTWNGYSLALFFEFGPEISEGKGLFTLGIDCAFSIKFPDPQYNIDSHNYGEVDASLAQIAHMQLMEIEVDFELQESKFIFDGAEVSCFHNVETDDWSARDWYLIGTHSSYCVGHSSETGDLGIEVQKLKKPRQ